jgi:hypothetical protein
MMDHENIAKVRRRTTDAGRPYFVMELVRGIPINEFAINKSSRSVSDWSYSFKSVRRFSMPTRRNHSPRPCRPMSWPKGRHGPAPEGDRLRIAMLGPSLTDHARHRLAQLVGTPMYMSLNGLR